MAPSIPSTAPREGWGADAWERGHTAQTKRSTVTGATCALLWALVAPPIAAQDAGVGAAGKPPIALPAVPALTPAPSQENPTSDTDQGQAAAADVPPPPASATDPAWGLDDGRLPMLWPDPGLRERVRKGIQADGCPLTPESAPSLWATLGLTPAEGVLVIRRMESTGEVVVSPDRRAVFPVEGCR